MLKLSLPVEANLFRPLVTHPKVLKVVALSGGYTRDEACAELARNEGMIASFSRALLDGLRAQMSDVAFDAALGEATVLEHRERGDVGAIDIDPLPDRRAGDPVCRRRALHCRGLRDHRAGGECEGRDQGEWLVHRTSIAPAAVSVR